MAIIKELIKYPVTTPNGGASKSKDIINVLSVPNVSTQTGEYIHMKIYMMLTI